MTAEVLAINPGSTSTKIAWFAGEERIWQETVNHDPGEISAFEKVADQYEFRKQTIEDSVLKHGSSLDDLDAVVGRGGVLDPIPGGTYGVDEELISDLRRGKPWEHASNLGGIIADAIARPRDIPSYIVDPVAVDELDDISRLTGLPEFPKRSLGHALNIKATVRRAAKELGRSWDDLDVIVAHLGGGITVCPHRHGRMIDLNNANEFGPFSPERAGGLPAGDLARLCYSGDYNMLDLRKRLVGNGGLKAYLGTSDMREVSSLVKEGDLKAGLVYRAMALQISKEIGACSVALFGKVDAILLTGGVVHDSSFVELIMSMVQWIAPVLVYPGEDEMAALAQGALRVLSGEEKALVYRDCVLRRV
ncbi:MAG TPA: butyrate kinase [Synergistales bacterium]|jgi:butyrate kinase|nr:butyrate kinase [Synergistales bacterium]HRV71734.1 butyrate kinase [Thermovirgaceae bacterium]